VNIGDNHIYLNAENTTVGAEVDAGIVANCHVLATYKVSYPDNPGSFILANVDDNNAAPITKYAKGTLVQVTGFKDDLANLNGIHEVAHHDPQSDQVFFTGHQGTPPETTSSFRL